MGIYKPEIHLSENDKIFLNLLAKILIESLEQEKSSNLPKHLVPLSDSEAQKLLVLINKLLNSKEFTQASFFIDYTTNMDSGVNESNAKELFLSGRKIRGRKREMNTYRWSEFLVRLGLITSREASLRGSGADIKQMSFKHFSSMEKTLFETLNLHPLVIETLMPLILQQNKTMEELSRIDRGALKKTLTSTSDRIKNDDKTVPRLNICALIIIIANYSVLWTTRDWGVTGTISCLVGTHISLFKNK